MRLAVCCSVIIFTLLISCGSGENREIEEALDTRTRAFETKNADLYMSLISPDYRQEKKGKVVGVDGIKRNFESNVTLFDTLDVTNRDRTVYTQGDKAEVVQITDVSVTLVDSRTFYIQAFSEAGSSCGISNMVSQKIESPEPQRTPTPGETPAPEPAPSPESNMVLTRLDPGAAGGISSITLTGAKPGSTVHFRYSERSGGTRLSGGICDGQVLGLNNAQALGGGSAIADTTGTATLYDISIPPNTVSKSRFKLNEKIVLAKKGGKWVIVKESDADFLEGFVFGGGN
ncbi:MAG: nuclear transport factor 2 family protein [Deltaproteobacteria bacterium]